MTVEDRIDCSRPRSPLHPRPARIREPRDPVDRTETLELLPLLAIGMRDDAANRKLFAVPKETGDRFRRGQGKELPVEDTEAILCTWPGPRCPQFPDRPLILHDEILGTSMSRVPSPARSRRRPQFLELFSRELSVALNTLELLVAEKGTTVSESTERILREVAGPVDVILNDAAWVSNATSATNPTSVNDSTRSWNTPGRSSNWCTRWASRLLHDAVIFRHPDASNGPASRQTVLFVDGDDTIRRAARTARAIRLRCRNGSQRRVGLPDASPVPL
ncbi:MAG: hypothetical protein Ct9H300mP1_04350 [Planctomycetaceae bacterium]|nr:MAG: hypothetical protein Ct9H300mP1_04350 [Planctomycetaceae bacterium]